MKHNLLKINNIPAVLYGEKSEKVWLFVHGKYGCKEEAEAFAEIVCPKGAQVFSIDLPEHGERKDVFGFDPWHAVPELRSVMEYAVQRWAHVGLRANSIGSWFSMLAFMDMPPEKALFVSPILDMEKLIRNMMLQAAVSEAQLEQDDEIFTESGETLSWKYLQYAKMHPIAKWDTPTEILYAGHDTLTDRHTINTFVCRFNCGLTVMKDGEHWFHTPAQLSVLKSWEEGCT